MSNIRNNKNFIDIRKAGLLENIDICFEDLTPTKQHEIFEKLANEIIPENIETDLIEGMDYQDWISLIVVPQVMDTTWKGVTDNGIYTS
jgi:hypothetical protein